MIIKHIAENIHNQNWFAVGLSFLMALNVSPTKADDNQAFDNEQIIANRQASNDAMASYNFERFFNFFDTDYIINYGRGTKTLSLAEEKTSWKEYFSSNPKANYVRTPEKVYISKSNPLAMEMGTWVGGDGITVYS